jgi:hypothetical protein
VKEIGRVINRGYTQIVDGDLADYFGSIPHDELLTSVARRVSDRHMLHLIKMWLQAPVDKDRPVPSSACNIIRKSNLESRTVPAAVRGYAFRFIDRLPCSILDCSCSPPVLELQPEAH